MADYSSIFKAPNTSNYVTSYQNVQTGPLVGAQSWNPPAGQSYFPSQAPTQYNAPRFGQQKPSFGESLGSALTPALEKLGYGLGYRLTSGGQNPPSNSYGDPAQRNTGSQLAEAFMNKILDEVMSGKKQDKEGGTGLEDLSTQGIRAFAEEREKTRPEGDTMEVRFGPGRRVGMGDVFSGLSGGAGGGIVPNDAQQDWTRRMSSMFGY